MNVVLFPHGDGRARHFDLARPLTIGVIAALTLGILGTAFALGMQLGQRSSRTLGAGESDRWARVLGEQKAQFSEMKSQLRERVDAMAMRLGQMDAHVIRLEARIRMAGIQIVSNRGCHCGAEQCQRKQILEATFEAAHRTDGPPPGAADLTGASTDGLRPAFARDRGTAGRRRRP